VVRPVRPRTTAPGSQQVTLAIMLTQLNKNRLQVGLAVAPEEAHSGHKIRVVDGTNPEWYQELCAKYLSTNRKNRKKRNGKKHDDTKIKRRRIIEALTLLSQGRMSRSIYAEDLLELARDLEEEWEEER